MSMSPTRAQYAASNSPVECFAPPASCKPGHKKPVKGKGESFPPCFELEEENARSQIEKQKTPGNAFRLRSSSHAHRDVVVAFPLLLTRHNSFPRRTKNVGYPCADSDSVADDFTQSDMSALLAPLFRLRLSASCRCHLQGSGQRCRRSLGMAFYACRPRQSRG